MTNILLGIIALELLAIFQSWTSWKRGAERMNNVSLTGRLTREPELDMAGRTIAQLLPALRLR